MKCATVVSSVLLGFILAVVAGLAQAEAKEPVGTAAGSGIAASEMRGEEMPFPVGWVPEAELPDIPREMRGPAETGALPEVVTPETDLRGTEHPFPVGWVPE
ncbi:MAG: hypothetical protein ACM31I_09445 [Deltaproteobacteria bacterium]